MIFFQAPGPGGAMMQFLPIVAIFAVFYFLLIRPQQKRQKQLQETISSLKNGDRVVTNSGIRGTIVGLKDDSIVLRIPPDQIKLELLRSSIASVETGTEG